MVNPSDQSIDVLLRVADNKTSWMGGAHFRGEGFSTKSSSATWPSTATGNHQHGLSVFAYTGRADRAGGAESEATGDLRNYSGHGPQIDGAPLLGVTAPDNPSTTWPASANEVGPAGYGSFNGTSGAGPHVAGARRCWFKLALAPTPGSLCSYNTLKSMIRSRLAQLKLGALVNSV